MQNEASQAEIVDSQLQEVDDEHSQTETGTNINTESHTEGTYTKKVMDDLVTEIGGGSRGLTSDSGPEAELQRSRTRQS
ncbi:hypothetical protein ElyMa_001772800 [Elysia marginata]|uniref:CTNNB1 binding N-teminal domain-containing protein n=1 Tax=Elysia marginata TaxID=1093978 RepID=A0AAV4ED62_9GAST|nr:hypothetical protein ElyMa_001772800 [Elysia marginata]